MTLQFSHIAGVAISLTLMAGCEVVGVVGEGIRTIGEGVQRASDPSVWGPLLKRLSEDQSGSLDARPLTPEEEEFLLATTVAVDISSNPESPTGFGTGANSLSLTLRDYLIRVEIHTGYRFDWRLSPQLTDAAMAFPGGIIILNPHRIHMLDVATLYLVLFHEAGHQILGHTSDVGMVSAMSQPWLRPRYEINSDLFAAEAMRRMGFANQDIIYAAISLFGDRPATPAHPSGRERVLAIRTFLAVQ